MHSVEEFSKRRITERARGTANVENRKHSGIRI
jgi:hypothetical protein